MTDKFKACSIEGCEGNAHSSARGTRGFCRSHYNRMCRHGDPLGGGPTRGYAMQFVTVVAVTYEGDDCLVWPFRRDKKGYGKIAVGGKMILTHRYVCELVHGVPPTSAHHAAHSCGKGHEGCVNPNHLKWATPSENMQDKRIHGTNDHDRRKKLSIAQVNEIRSLKGKRPQHALASAYGVSRSMIGKIHNGKNWSEQP